MEVVANFVAEYGFLILAVVAAVIAIAHFIKGSVADAKEWLVYATSIAEKHFGGGTGVLKLRYVYDMFLTKFPWLAKVISFDHFSKLVDDALAIMKANLEKNNAIKEFVNGPEEVEETK